MLNRRAICRGLKIPRCGFHEIGGIQHPASPGSKPVQVAEHRLKNGRPGYVAFLKFRC
jgi:hypothetical protein